MHRFTRHHHPETIGDTIDALMKAVFIDIERDRLRSIGEHVTGDFVYIAPGGVFEGGPGLSDAFSGFRHDQWRHTTIHRTTVVDLHHEHFRHAWERREGSDVVMQGWSFGEVRADGRIARIVSFDGLILDPNE